jgi:hypothetical protein
VFAAQAPPGRPFETAAVLSRAGTAREPQLVATPAGTVVAAWLRTTGEGNAVEAALRPRGGAFAAPATVAPSSQKAFAPRLAATGGGEVLAAWVRTNETRGFGAASGDLRVQRLAPDGRPLGERRGLTPSGVRVREPVLAPDGRGGAIAVWRGTRSGRPLVQARRVARDATPEAVRTLSGDGPVPLAPPALASMAGRAVAAWVESERVRYSVYR